MTFRWFQHPHWVRRAGYAYESNEKFYFRDALSRIHSEYNNDYYLSPSTGKIKSLVVQSVDDVLSNEGNGTWKRTYIRTIAPLPYRLAMWPFNHIDMRESSPESNSDVAKIVGKWFVASLALTVVVSRPSWSASTSATVLTPSDCIPR
jgi:hypothetical protein